MAIETELANKAKTVIRVENAFILLDVRFDVLRKQLEVRI